MCYFKNPRLWNILLEIAIFAFQNAQVYIDAGNLLFNYFLITLSMLLNNLPKRDRSTILYDHLQKHLEAEKLSVIENPRLQ